MESAALARQIAVTLASRGFQAYLVGGCVRDLLLGRKPSDYDVATDARPEQILQLYPQALQVGAAFGVILVSEDGAQVEVATFRSDFAYADGRHPGEVRFETDLRQDALRRDFTVNALFQDPQSGEILDFTGGRQDLRDGLIRAVGEPEERFWVFTSSRLPWLRSCGAMHRSRRFPLSACAMNWPPS
jgi:poly(A) polymerase